MIPLKGLNATPSDAKGYVIRYFNYRSMIDRVTIQPDPDPEAAKRLQKRNQDRTLKLLLPSYRLAVSQDQTNAYLDRASLIWFLRFPDAEDGVHVHKPFLDDSAYEAHIRDQRLKVRVYSKIFSNELLTIPF